MNAQAILEKIEQDAREAASAILNDANSRATEMKNASEEKIKKMHDDVEHKAAADGEELEQRMYRMDELEQRKQLLAAKREQIDKAFALALEKLKAMPKDKIHSFLVDVVASCAEGGESIIVGKQASEWFSESFVSDVNKALEGKGKQGNLQLSQEKRDGVTGIILSRNESEIDCSFEALIRASRLDMEQKVAAILFP